jgi:hypothetical protein
MAMKTFNVYVERVIDASPGQVYNVIADMEEHRRIERMLVPPITRSIYRQELENINRHLTSGNRTGEE